MNDFAGSLQIYIKNQKND